MPKDPGALATECTRILNEEWADVHGEAVQGTLGNSIADQALLAAIHACVNSSTRTYRYVLPTQVLAKLADASLDCRSLQKAEGGAGAFDARSVCHAVIVPFDRDNDRVLGGSPEPYVNNPLRQPAVSRQYRDKQKDKVGWDYLCDVLDTVEGAHDPAFTASVFRQILVEVHRRLAEISVTYPVPLRISLEQCMTMVEQFLLDRSGGDRAQAIATALFMAIGDRFKLFTEVRRANINAADASSGQVADLECVNAADEIVMAVEVKDQALTVRQIQDKLPLLRNFRVAEAFFLALKGIAEQDVAQVEALTAREYASGQNLYVVRDFTAFLKSVLALLGEDGRRVFLVHTGTVLNTYRSELRHRQAWVQLLAWV